MERYREYMNRVQVSDELHERIVRRKKRSDQKRSDRDAFLNGLSALVCMGFVMFLGVAAVIGTVGGGKNTESAVDSLTGAYQTTHAVVDMPDKEQVGSDSAESVQGEKEGWESNGEESVSEGAVVENESAFPEHLMAYVPPAGDFVYEETVGTDRDGEPMWTFCWNKGETKITLVVTVDRMPYTTEGDFYNESIPPEGIVQIAIQKLVASQPKDQTMFGLVFDVGGKAFCYTIQNMSRDDALAWLGTMPMWESYVWSE